MRDAGNIEGHGVEGRYRDMGGAGEIKGHSGGYEEDKGAWGEQREDKRAWWGDTG